MKKLLIILFSALSLTAVAETPNWYNSSDREANYPKMLYFTGYAEGQRQSGESLDAALIRMKNSARVEALSTIRVHVQNTTINHRISQTLRTMEGTFRQSIREIDSESNIKVDMEIPGLQVEAWQNPANGNILAFAYVEKSSLIRQLEKKITINLTKIETALDQIDQFVANGQKIQARELAHKTLPLFEELNETQEILASVDENADEKSLQMAETRTLQRRLTDMVAQLKNGINIFLSCTASMFGQNYNALKGEIEGELSKMGVTFVKDAAQSDWAIYVDASAREYNIIGEGNSAQYVVYVDAKVAIDKTITGQRIFSDQLAPEKGMWIISYVEAARRDGYKKITPKIINLIKEQIQQ